MTLSAFDAVRLRALLSRLDPHAAGACPVEGCEHRGGTPRETEPPRRPRPALQAA